MTLAYLLRIALVAVAVAVVVGPPFLLKPSGVLMMSQWATLAIAAMGLNLTLGYAGQISLAQGAFVGIGAYATALCLKAGVPFLACCLGAGFICFAIGWVLGYPALRVQHHYLAFVTLAFSTVVFLILRNEEWATGGVYGINDIPRPSLVNYEFLKDAFGWSTGQAKAVDFYLVSLVVLALLSLAFWGMIRSPWGRAFVALRENPIRALSLGVDTRRYTLIAFAIGSAYGGLSGAVYAPLVQYIEPSSFALTLSLNLLLMVITGGTGYFLGPFIGAAVAILLPEWLRFTQGYYLTAYALLVMLLMVFCPTGVLGLTERFADWVRAKAETARRATAKPLLGIEEGKG